MNFLVLSMATVVALILGGLVWWRYKNAWGAIALPIVIVGLVTVVLPPEVQPIEELVDGDSPDVAAPPIRQASVTQEELKEFRPIEVPSHGFVGSDACIECHADNHTTWEASYHSKMTQVATPDAVLGDFEQVHVKNKGLDYYLFKEGDTFMANIPNMNGEKLDNKKRSTVPIVMTTGSHHMQIYWFPTGNGRLTGMLPLIHLNETHEWIPRNSAFLMVHGEDSFEAGRWNAGCSNCHSTHRKTRQATTGKWDTHVGEFAISCEACHGPGEDHISYHRTAVKADGENATANESTVDPIVNPESLDKVRSSQVCGQCHSLMEHRKYDKDFQENGSSYRAGDDLLKSHRILNSDSPQYLEAAKMFGYEDISSLLSQTYYGDGMVRVSGREFNGMTQSSCYINGEMTCLSCHKMHKSDSDDRTLKQWANDQLQPEALGDNACLQCHESEQYADVKHTHHPVGSSGASCYNCHMPHTVYGLLKGIRNHNISSPNIATDVKAQRPNACNLCHIDQTLQWSADHLKEWYDIQPPELDRDQKTIAASILWMLKGNAAERALAAHTLGWDKAQEVGGTDWLVPFLAALLDDDYEAIRLIARRSLTTLPGLKNLKMDVVTASSIEDRQAGAMRLFENWMVQTARTRTDRPRLLMDSIDGYQIDRVEQLLKNRDITPMVLIE